ncbi:RagB/SusD family nutrient uptake outer membrane protein [Puteibacter caeruleilacunae]|nr:RagB/SusD family nutrient uptake outer membrane protein [Puteibacter caeruleilacunae]
MKNIVKLTYILIGLLMFSSCEKDLDLYPLTKASEGTFFLKENDFKIFTNQFYAYLPGFGLCSRDNYADIGFTRNSISNSSYIESQTSGLWDGSYANIRNTTQLIERVTNLEDAALKSEVEVYEAEARFFRAYTYFNLMKDYGGVPLIDKVLALEDEEYLQAPRASRETILDFILADLDKAISLPLGSLDGAADVGRITKEAALALKARVCLFEGTWRKYHQSGGDANTLLTQAADAAAQVMNSGKFELFDRRDVLGDESYRYFFVLETSMQSNPANLGKQDQKEIILATKFHKEERNMGGSYISLRNGNLSPTKKMADMFLDDTGLPITHANTTFMGHGFSINPVDTVAILTEYMHRDPRMNSVFIEPFEQFWYHKPYNRDFTKTGDDLLGTGGWNDGFWTSASGYLIHKFIPENEDPVAIDYPVFRLAEMMLIYAEAKFEKDGSISDGDLDISINKLRDRVGMPHLTNAFVGTNGLDMQTELRRERAVELYLEGFRFDDLRRWKTAKVEMSQAVKGVKWAGTPYETPFMVYNEQQGKATEVDHTLKGYELDADGFAILEPAEDRQFEDKHYLFPLPLRQLKLNPQLEQNPGWVSQ